MKKNTASGSRVDSNINNSKKDRKRDGQPNMNDKNIRDGPSESESSREKELDMNNLPMDPGERKMILEYPLNLQDIFDSISNVSIIQCFQSKKPRKVQL